MQRPLLLLAAALMAGAVARSQNPPPANPDASATSAKPELRDVKSAQRSATPPLLLKDVGPLSPEDAAKLAAQDLAKPKDAPSADKLASKSKNQDKTQTKDAVAGAVVEFQPAGSGSGSAAPVTVNDKKSHSSRVHGDLYGAAGGNGHATSESVGATSKSRKTSVYVQSDQARSDSNPAQ